MSRRDNDYSLLCEVDQTFSRINLISFSFLSEVEFLPSCALAKIYVNRLCFPTWSSSALRGLPRSFSFPACS